MPVLFRRPVSMFIALFLLGFQFLSGTSAQDIPTAPTGSDLLGLLKVDTSVPVDGIAPAPSGHSTPESPDPTTEAPEKTVTTEYKPPPPPTSRNETSEGQCSFDPTLWRIEPQSAIANAVMFERRSGITCEECLQTCIDHQTKNSKWVCRTLTYDNRWNVCDLYTVSGTVSPRYLTVYRGRDYFEYLNAGAPTAAELLALTADSEAPKKTEIPIRASGFPIVPTSPILTLKERLAKMNRNTVSKEEILELKSVEIQNDTKQEQPQEKQENMAVEREGTPRTPGMDSCGEGEITRFSIILNAERANPGTETQLVSAKTPEDCAKACNRDELFTCVSAVFSNSGCELSPTPADHNIPQEFHVAERSMYLEKVCLDAKLAERTRLLWPTVRNHVLIGHVLEVATTETLDDCQMACLRAEEDYGFVCQSGMWYPADEEQNCLLNAENRYTQSEVFVPEEVSVQMLYFDVPREDPSSDSNSARWYKDDPLVEESGAEYTKWTKCTKKASGNKHRYLKCKEHKDVRKCPKETKPCAIKVKSLKNACLAVRDALGRKRCPHGIKKHGDGTSEYCSKPIDC